MAEDTTPPTGTIVINGNRSATNTPNVTLALTWSDGDGTGVSRMRFSNDGSTWSPWEAPVASRAYTLPAGPDSHRTVRVQYLDRANNRSAVYSDYIRLDTTLPTGTIIINGGASTTASRSVVLGLTWSDGGGSGVTRMRFSDNGSTWTYWMPPKATRSHTLPAGAGYHTVRVQYLDGAGNYSAIFKDYIKLLPAPPQAAFQATPSSGTPPLTVEFEDLSVAGDGPIDSWTWDFGDGSPTSSAPHPTHTYTDLGIYTVTLTVKSGTSQGHLVKDGAVNVATTVADAFDQFVDPGVPVDEAADGMFAAMDAAFEAGGAEAVQQELESSLYGYLNAGGDPAVLLQRSEAAPAAGLSLDQVQARRLLKAGEKAGYDVILPESQACTNVVIFINGINTSGPDGKMAYYALRGLLGLVIRDKDAAVEFVYNPSACGLWGFILDLGAECTKQKVLDAVALIGAELQGTDAVVQTLTSRIQAHVAKGRNVIIVPHSQGNFYTQQALWNLTAAERLKVHVVETGSPVSAALDAAGDFRVDIEGDLVGKLGYPRYTEPPFPYEGTWGLGTWINWWIPFKMWDSELLTLTEHHSFQGAYMMGQASQAIRAKVNEFSVLPAPVLGAFSVNNGAASASSRTVTLNNACTRSTQEYMASESASFSGAAWLPYSPTPSFLITSAGNGVKTVYFKVRNVDGLASGSASDQITLTEVAEGPVITSVTPNPVPGSASVQTLTVNGSGFVSGCTVRLRDYTDNLGPWTKAAAFVNAERVTLSANFGTGATSWTAQVINPNGTLSAEYAFTVSMAQQGVPTVNAFAVNAGSGTTVFRGVTLNGVCTGSPGEYLASESSSFTGATWQVYSTAPSFIITSPGYGTKTVWFKVRNAAGESNTASDTITLEENTGTTETIMLPGNVPLSLVRIPAGSFQMGSPDTEQSHDGDEGPVHTVTIGYDFYMGKYEVTQGQWLAVMGTNPGGYTWNYGVGADYPAYYVSWNDAQAFIRAANAHITRTGQGPATMRLPSEAEWEYACRAGTQTRFHFGDSLGVADVCEDDGERSQYMWYCGNNTGSPGQAGYGSKPVGGLFPNGFGLHDMSGNLREWCEDWMHLGGYTGAPADGSAWVSPTASARVLRGGYWDVYARYCRSAYRGGHYPSHRGSNIGFRLASVR